MDLHRKSLTVNEILIALEEDECQNDIETTITIFPPDNCNDPLTDEDSGDEEIVTLGNLPGSQLRGEGELSTRFNRCTLVDERGEDNGDRDQEATDTRAKKRKVSAQKTKTRRKRSVGGKKSTDQTEGSYNWAKLELNVDSSSPFLPIYDVKNQLKTPLEYFSLFYDDEVIDMFVKNTNKYIAMKNFVGDVSYEEMLCFFGVLLYSGYVDCPRKRMYFETGSADMNHDIVTSSISRTRFELIMSNVHVCDNRYLDKTDRYAKVRPLYNILNKKFVEYAPHEEFHSIDESMVPYYGKNSLKQRILGKPVRFGYKVWVGSTYYGYVLWKDPYQGRSQVLSQYKDLGLGASVILSYADVLRTIGDHPYNLYYDNFFGGLPLLEHLNEKGIFATCTMRENRLKECPLEENAKFKKQERGSFDYRSDEKKRITICKWNDNSVVTIATNSSSAINPVGLVKRFSQAEKNTLQ
ncbi:piggyBac transposable element-derived protein 3-like [Diaphorina citri]|uniref:PiggyBac transposable element-derived protein 3-like n=1 Tax=Diaphorina citri TaxID=121845 RepID=A0A1S3D993_DIACI|nr:piggyBac transposable element-derived protein 3-like [Diaphorina citri]